jgi:dipeptide/tripeptide permease
MVCDGTVSPVAHRNLVDNNIGALPRQNLQIFRGSAFYGHWLGKRRAVIISGGIMAAGHFMMTFEPLFYFALGSSMKKMALGALLVAAAYLLLAIVASSAGTDRANWLWLVLFFVVFTVGELYILPTGLGLFARLAPIGLGATTIAAWFLATFSGSLSAGIVGTLWAGTSHARFFAILSVIAATAAAMLYSLDRATQRIETP